VAETIQTLVLSAPDVAISGSVPVPVDDAIALCRVMVALLSRGESSLALSFPGRALESVLGALNLLGLVRRDVAGKVLIRGVGLGATALPETR
jgi:hypothetical protein